MPNGLNSVRTDSPLPPYSSAENETDEATAIPVAPQKKTQTTSRGGIILEGFTFHTVTPTLPSIEQQPSALGSPHQSTTVVLSFASNAQRATTINLQPQANERAIQSTTSETTNQSNTGVLGCSRVQLVLVGTFSYSSLLYAACYTVTNYGLQTEDPASFSDASDWVKVFFVLSALSGSSAFVSISVLFLLCSRRACTVCFDYLTNRTLITDGNNRAYNSLESSGPEQALMSTYGTSSARSSYGAATSTEKS